MTIHSLARVSLSLPPRANSPASAGVFYHLPNPFAFGEQAPAVVGDRQEVEAIAAIGQADAMVSTSESGLDELTFAYVTGGVRAALAREIGRLRGTSC